MGKITVHIYEKVLYYYFTCPGCEIPHMINNTWQFNKNFNRPTIEPSIKVTGAYKNDEGFTMESICHSKIKDGFISFLNDCTHKLKGQTVELPERIGGN